MKEEIKLYGEIGHGINALNFANKLTELEKQGCTHLTIHLHSQGGDVISGNLMYNAMQQSSIHIKIVIDGIAASMASIIILGADEVEICENAFIMIHRPQGALHGNVDDMQANAKVLSDIEDNFVKSYSEKSKLSANEVRTKWLNGADHWLNAKEAVQYGFADRIVLAVAKDIGAFNISASMCANTLYKKFVASFNKNNDVEMKKELIKEFELEGVTEDSTDEEIINKLVEKFEALKTKVDEVSEANIDALLSTAVKEKKLNATQIETYKQIGKTNGMQTLTTILNNARPPIPSISAYIADHRAIEASNAKNTPKNKVDWTLEDYRKNAPMELKTTPNYMQIYARLNLGSDINIPNSLFAI